MISFLIYTPEGRILAAGYAIDETAASSNLEGTANGILFDIPLGVRPDAYYIHNNECYEIPAQPSPNHVFNYSLKQWTDPRSLEMRKTLKNAEINEWRANANQTSFVYLSKDIACDQLSRSDIDAVNGEISLTGSFPAGWPGGWKCMDNTYIAITDVPTWTSFYQAMTAQGTANFNHAQELKALVAAATTFEELDAIVW